MQRAPAKAQRPSPGGYPESVRRLIDEFTRLPGIGPRSAERMAFHVLMSGREAGHALAQAIESVLSQVRPCSICFNITDADPCAICADARRDGSTVLVVEQPRDLIALEQTGMYRGVYHVLMGRLSPLDGIGPGELTIDALVARVDDPARNAGQAQISEVILGLNPTLEGDGTALYLGEQLKKRDVRVSRLARGLPTGGQLEYANKAVLGDAIQGRRSME